MYNYIVDPIRGFMETTERNSRTVKGKNSSIKSHNINSEKGAHKLSDHQLKSGRGHDHFADRHNKGRGK